MITVRIVAIDIKGRVIILYDGFYRVKNLNLYSIKIFERRPYPKAIAGGA